MPFRTFDPVNIPLVDPSQVGDARRSAVALAASLDFGDRLRAEVAIVVTEAATNLVRHATGGEVVFRSVHDRDDPAFEMLAIDRGPGIADLAESLRDGYSTGGTPGTGLGAIARLSRAFDAFTRPGTGTVLLARLGPEVAGPPRLPVGAVSLPKRGEEACGDQWHVEVAGDGRTRVLVADGLGHGLHAADASRLAVRIFRDHPDLGPAPMIDALHAGLRATRGAAVAVAELPAGDGEARFAGVGNVAGSILGVDGKGRSLVSHNGTAGAEVRRVQEFAYPWHPGDLLLMHTDGLASQWQLARYPGLRARHPAVVAGVLYRDFRRERDDVTVLAIGGADGTTRP